MNWKASLREHRALVAVILLWGIVMALPLALSGTPMPSADLYNHVSFIKQYQAEPLDTYLPGQDTGLDIGSYPPLSFQIGAVLGTLLPIPLPILVQLLQLVALGAVGILGARYLRVIGAIDDAPLVAAGIVAVPGIAQMLLVYGQYPNLLSMAFMLGAMVCWHRADTRSGKLLLAGLVALTGFTHLLTMLALGIWIGVSAAYRVLRGGEDWADLPLLPVIGGGLLVMAGMYHVLLQSLEVAGTTPIYHPSRAPLSGIGPALFAFVPYHLLTLPLLYVWQRDRLQGEWLWVAGVMLVLGLGLTTPLPHIFLGLADWLVYDRFAAIGALLVGGFIVDRFGKRGRRSGYALLCSLIIASLLLGTFQHSVLFDGGLSTDGGLTDHTAKQRATTLAALDRMNSSQRYLTLGYGRPTGDLFAMHPQPALMTAYYTGRTSPTTRELGLGKLDSADAGQVQTIIRDADALSLGYILTYGSTQQLMDGSGWRSTALGGDIILWTNPEPVSPVQDQQQTRPLFAVLPPLVLAFVIGTLLWRHRT